MAGTDRTWSGKIVIRFLYWTGCRLGEMRAVTVDDIDFDTDVTGAAVRIDEQKTENGDIVPPKTEAGDRTVELPDAAAALLKDYIERNELDSDDEVFPMSEDTYRRTDVKQAFTRAGEVLVDSLRKNLMTAFTADTHRHHYPSDSEPYGT